jgi:hypothetical protein
MKRFCYNCRMRTEHIEDFNSRICKRCGRIEHLGNVHFSSGIVKVPKFSDKIRVRKLNI